MQISQMLICNKYIACSRDRHLSKRQLTHMHLSISTADLCLTKTLVLEPDSCHTSMFMHHVNYWRLNCSGFFHDFQHQLNWQLQYNWNIIYSGVKHHNPTSVVLLLVNVICAFHSALNSVVWGNQRKAQNLVFNK